jgi:hypothetical protein
MELRRQQVLRPCSPGFRIPIGRSLYGTKAWDIWFHSTDCSCNPVGISLATTGLGLGVHDAIFKLGTTITSGYRNTVTARPGLNLVIKDISQNDSLLQLSYHVESLKVLTVTSLVQCRSTPTRSHPNESESDPVRYATPGTTPPRVADHVTFPTAKSLSPKIRKVCEV